MFPGVNGFHWTIGHIVFLSVFFTVASVIAVTATVAALRAWSAFRQRRDGRIRWQSEFHDLPARERRCRHMLAGEVEERLCPNFFECRACADHPKFVSDAVPSTVPVMTFGLDYPADRFYHRGHTWLRPEADGTLTVGLDDLGRRLIGQPDAIELPAVGAHVENSGLAWKVRKNGSEFRVLAPVEGEVVETGGPDKGWFLRLRPVSATLNLTHLLHGQELTGWLRDELDRLQLLLSPACTGPSLADGGVLMEDLTKSQPDADWDQVFGTIFLEP